MTEAQLDIRTTSSRKAKRYEGGDIIMIILFIYFTMSYLALIETSLRYLKYCLAPIAAMFYYSKGTKRITEIQDYCQKYIYSFLKFYALLYCFYAVYQIIIGSMSIRFIADSLFVLLPIITVYYLVPFIKFDRITSYLKIIFIFTIIGYVIEKNETIIASLNNLGSLVTGIQDSSVKSESNLYPFLLAFLFLFAFYYRLGWRWIITLFIFSFLGFKRIVLLGLLLVVFLSYFPFIYKFVIKRKRFFSYLFSFLALLIIIAYYYVASGYFDSYLLNRYGIYTNELLQGREVLYNLVIQHIGNNKLFLGAGVGVVDQILAKNASEIQNITNLHSELLRWFLEIGGLGYFIWIYFIFKNSLVTRYVFLGFLFLFIILLTDNVIIYFDCMFYFYLLSVFSILIEIQKAKNASISRLAKQQAKH